MLKSKAEIRVAKNNGTPRDNPRVTQSTIRFLTHYVQVTKCLPNTKDKQNPKQTLPNKVLRDLQGHRMTPCDTYTKRLEPHYASALADVLCALAV